MTKTKSSSKQASANDQESTQDINFEASLEELETLVSSMESGDLSLDESLKAFERGVLLTRQCQTALKNAELKVRVLTEEGEFVDMDTDLVDDT